MSHWMCESCGYYLQGNLPPDRCPSCNQVCVFKDVTCYRPECGGENNIDPLLVGSALGSLTKTSTTREKQAITRSTGKPIPAAEIFRGLSERQMKSIRDLGNLEHYGPGEIICKEGDEALKLYVVEEGQVAVKTQLVSGTSSPLTIITENAAFGWSSLVPPHIFRATVSALTKTTVLAIERGALSGLMHNEPLLGLTIMQNVASIIASRFNRFEEEMIAFANQKF